MISVVISTYNRPDRLKKAIQSVIDQTYTDWELIVVDDCSTIDIHNLVAGYVVNLPDNKIKYVRLDKNFGNDTKPKNTGILKSKGEYVAFLDDDNSWRPDHLQALVNEMENYDDADLVY